MSSLLVEHYLGPLTQVMIRSGLNNRADQLLSGPYKQITSDRKHYPISFLRARGYHPVKGNSS